MSVTTVSSKSKASASKRSTQAPQETKANEDAIRILAYSLYERRSADGLEGDAASDWLEAERQLLDE